MWSLSFVAMAIVMGVAGSSFDLVKSGGVSRVSKRQTQVELTCDYRER